MVKQTAGTGMSGNRAGSAAPVAPSISNAPKKASLEQVISSTNFPVYQRAAAVVKNYQQIGDTPEFNPNTLGKVLYGALSEMIAEVPNKEERQDVAMLLDVLQRHLQNNTLTREGFEATLQHTKAFMNHYAQKIKRSLEDGHYKTMALGVLQNKEVFSGLYSQLSAHPTAARASQLGSMLKDIEEAMKKNDLSGLSSYYQKLMTPNAVSDYVGAGKTAEQANAIVASGGKAYQSLVNSLSEGMKAEHQAFIHKLVGQGYYQAAQRIDLGHIKNVIGNADPADLLALIPQGRQSAGYQSE